MANLPIFPPTLRGLAVALGLSAIWALSAHGDERPNILFIMSDDHAAHAISAYGGRLAGVAPTPNLDSLAASGMRFTNAFVTNSICTPIPSVLITGRSSPVKASTWTPSSSKWATRILPESFGREIRPFTRDGTRLTSSPKKALDWFAELREPDQPFFYMLDYNAPHDLWQHAPRYADNLADVKIPEPENLMDSGSGRSKAIDQSTQEIAGRSHHTQFTPEIKAIEAGPEKRRLVYQEYMKRYLRCVKGIDDNLGKVFAYLKESDLDKNTIVIYTADQGFFLGEHGLYDKRFMYEESLRVPLLVRWPGQIEPASVCDELVLNLDYPETILDLAGCVVPGDMQGRSFAPLLRGQAVDDWRTAFYFRYYFSHFDTPSHLGVRTKNEKLIHFDGLDHWELYNLSEDPAEMKNVVDSPQYRERLMSLKTELMKLGRQVGDDPKDVGDHPRTGNAELDKMMREMMVRQAKKAMHKKVAK